MTDAAPTSEFGPEQFGVELTRAVVAASRLGLSRRNDVAIACLAYLQQRTFPPDLLVLTRGDVEESWRTRIATSTTSRRRSGGRRS